jgi:hypothetical protein
MKTKIIGKDGKFKIVDLSRRKAIKARCLDCSGWEYNEVNNCEHTKCELYPYRMGIGKQDPILRRKAIRAYCLNNCMLGQKAEVTKCTSWDYCPLYPFRLGTYLDKSVKNYHIEQYNGIKI